MANVKYDADCSENQHFVKLFDDVLKIIREDLSDGDISKAVFEIVLRRRRSISNSCAVENFESLTDLCAYFYRFSPISAGLARNKTLAAIRDCKELRSCLEQPSLKILSVGSGPGSDLIGLCSALYESKLLYEKTALEKLKLILVDNNEKWETLFQATVQVLCESNFGYTSRFFKSKEVSTEFICCDVSKTADVEYEEAFEEADIIWVKGLLSFLRSSNARSCALKTIMTLMKPGTLLMVIDSPECKQFEKYTVDLKLIFSKKSEGFLFGEEPRIIYGPGICSFTDQELSVFVKFKFD
ncbi:uncharacterized protein TNCT_407851 [Trichonephila clavata]|uniref:Uncharacterized protein n=1 Tax=Trichonephila clavata TaxID=2740835 RepID=A0A8X6IGJ3_TRICU|nr:uncharacterized protein TNCT_407851 [Trichonephila clavata]